MFKNSSLSTKTYCGFGVITLFLVIVSVYSWTRINTIGKGIELVVQYRFPKTVAANNVINGINEAARCVRNMIIMEKKEDIYKEAERIEATRKKVSEELNKLQQTVNSDRGKAQIHT
jgi:methyl-accepting chemotaxis protein